MRRPQNFKKSPTFLKLPNNVKTKWNIFFVAFSEYLILNVKDHLFSELWSGSLKIDFFHLIAFTNFKIRIIFTEKKIVIFEEPNFFLERYIMRRYYYQIIFSPQLISFGGFSTSWVYNTYLELRGLTKPFPFLIVKILILS